MTESLRRDPTFGPGVPSVDERMFALRRALDGAKFTDGLQEDIAYLAFHYTGAGVSRILRLLDAARAAEHELTLDNLLGGHAEYRPDEADWRTLSLQVLVR